MKTPTAQDIMTRNLLKFAPDSDIYEVVDLLVERRISGAPVVDSDGALVGVISEKDCLRVLKGHAWDGLPEGRVGDYMSQPVRTVEQTVSVVDIVGLFLELPFRRLPVVDSEGTLVGLVSRRDVLRNISSMKDNPYLTGTPDRSVSESEDEGTGGVASAMRRARDL